MFKSMLVTTCHHTVVALLLVIKVVLRLNELLWFINLYKSFSATSYILSGIDLPSAFLSSTQAICVCMLLFVCVCHCCYWFLSLSTLSWSGAWLQHARQCLLPFILALAFITKFLLAFPPSILRLEGFQWTFISPCVVIILSTPHTPCPCHISLKYYEVPQWRLH